MLFWPIISPLKKHAGFSLPGNGVDYICAKDIIKLYTPDKKFRIYGNLILYLMRYTFRTVNLGLASAGQLYGQHLTWLIFQG